MYKNTLEETKKQHGFDHVFSKTEALRKMLSGKVRGWVGWASKIFITLQQIWIKVKNYEIIASKRLMEVKDKGAKKASQPSMPLCSAKV